MASSSSSSKAETLKNTNFARRQLTVMKKAHELSTLCDIEAAVICYGPTGELQTWPPDISKVRELAQKYRKLSDSDKRRKCVDLQGFLGKTKTGEQKKRKRLDLKPDMLDGSTAEELSELLDFLDRKSKTLEARLRFLENQKQNLEGSSKSKHDQNQESDPPILSNSAETDHPMAQFDQQMTRSEHLQVSSLSSPYESFSAPCFSHNDILNRQIYPQIALSNSAVGSDLSLVQYDQQMTEFEHLQGCSMSSPDESFASVNNVGYSAPCYSNNFCSDIIPSQTPMANYQNFSADSAGGAWCCSSDPQTTLSNSVGYGLPMVQFEQQMTEFEPLQGCCLSSAYMWDQSCAPIGNVSYASAPCYYSNYSSDISQVPTPTTNYQNSLGNDASGDYNNINLQVQFPHTTPWMFPRF